MRNIILVFLILIPISSMAGDDFILPKQALVHLQQNTPYWYSAHHTNLSNSLGFSILYYVLVAMAISGIIPVITFFIEHNLSGLHAFSNHFNKCKDYNPRVAVIIPAWNEALVLEHTIDILIKIDYPLDCLRIYIIDDGSTDNTQELLKTLHDAHPDNVFHIYKEGGGKGKSHAVNFGLKTVLAEPWAEALLLIDADISFKKDALRRMARHLADPEVGAVTAYIKVGNRETNFITRSIGYEYIVSQAVARRAQNVIGVMACLAGGAQLHTRANIEALGGAINTTTLAEDTYTTFETQKLGKLVIYEGSAFVYAEEPRTIIEVWKQRFRWARGNIQITRAFKDVWFRSRKSPLGNWLFGIIWFCVLLTPVLMIASAVGLISLFFIDRYHSAHIFFYLASISLFVYLYTTILALLVDQRTSTISWLEGFLYPGAISLLVLAFSINPEWFLGQIDMLLPTTKFMPISQMILLFMEAWSALCMLMAWVVFRLEYMRVPPQICNFLLMIVGYGPLLCTINLAAYIAEIKSPNLKWDKTEKVTSKREIYPRPNIFQPYNFEKALAQDRKREYVFVWREILSLLIVSAIMMLLKYYKYKP